ncbi:hypothetical protein KUTeg_013531 [Tegillarca granosa]|uniref:Kringle domain-containing protein n=1 Tax=Tegillarca granosa TaxID=220873 RepID=A0ABQ9EXD5_TEGGR|nr:hypothetical protein KUTeg_013531 [Tegillarca granosa]
MDLGFVCMTWKYHSPHEHRYNFLEDNENFCRYADSEPKPWCYTINSDVRWGHCTIPMCIFSKC